MITDVLVRWGAVPLVVLGLWLATAARPSAHDLERTRVHLAFAPDGSFTLDLANDPEWLLLRLEPFLVDYPDLPVRPEGTRLPPADRDLRLAALAPVMVDRIVLYVDGREVRPSSVVYEPPAAPTEADGTPMAAHYRLQGRMGSDARMLRWFYGIVAILTRSQFPEPTARSTPSGSVERCGAGPSTSRASSLRRRGGR